MVNNLRLRYKIILIGDPGTGKTSLFWRYFTKELPQERTVTIVDYRCKSIQIQEQAVHLCLWDTAGQERFQSIIGAYFNNCDGIVLVFDLSEPKSWQAIKDGWYTLALAKAPGSYFLLLGNKKDRGVQVDLN